LHRRKIGSNHPAIIDRQASQPIKNRLRSARRAIENNRYLGQACRVHFSSINMYHKKYIFGKENSARACVADLANAT
jgi:hypothetical protein